MTFLAALLLLSTTMSPSVRNQVEDIPQLLIERSLEHGATPSEVLCVARKETGGTFDPYKIGSMGERGLGQWLPGRGNHWDRTPAWKVWRIDIVQEYRNGNPDAVWLDADMLAWSFGPEAPAGNKRGWTVWSSC